MTEEERRAILEAMIKAQLTDTKLVVVFMTLFGWTQEEIGQLLGIERQTVSYHWHDAVDRLSALAVFDDSADFTP